MREEIKICTFYIFSHNYIFIISYRGRRENENRGRIQMDEGSDPSKSATTPHPYALNPLYIICYNR